MYTWLEVSQWQTWPENRDYLNSQNTNDSPGTQWLPLTRSGKVLVRQTNSYGLEVAQPDYWPDTQSILYCVSQWGFFRNNVNVTLMWWQTVNDLLELSQSEIWPDLTTNKQTLKNPGNYIQVRPVLHLCLFLSWRWLVVLAPITVSRME